MQPKVHVCGREVPVFTSMCYDYCILLLGSWILSYIYQVISSLKRALQPAVTGVSLEFQVPPECRVLQSPQNLSPIFNGEKLVVYAVVQSKAPFKEYKCVAILRGEVLGKEQMYTVPFTFDSTTVAPSLPVIHHLAAKALIADWESERKEKKSIVDLSIESSVISSYTAFIAVDEENSEPVSSAMKTYDVTAKQRSYSSDESSEDDMSFEDEEEEEEGLSRRIVPSSEELEEEIEEEMQVPLRKGKVKRVERDELCEGELDYELASGSEGEGQERALKQRMEREEKQASADKITGLTALANLITAQQVNGSWTLNSLLAQHIGKSLTVLESACPIERNGTAASVWATVLAVSLLRARYSTQEDEWELIAMKAESWLKKQSLPSGCTLEQLFQAAQKYLS